MNTLDLAKEFERELLGVYDYTIDIAEVPFRDDRGSHPDAVRIDIRFDAEVWGHIVLYSDDDGLKVFYHRSPDSLARPYGLHGVMYSNCTGMMFGRYWHLDQKGAISQQMCNALGDWD